MGELVELAARCEAATANEQREWLEQSFYALNPAPEEYGEPRIPWVRLSHRFHDLICAKAYLDAALMLIPKDRFLGTLCQNDPDAQWYARIEAHHAVFEDALAATPALAMCAASLRARATEMKG